MQINREKERETKKEGWKGGKVGVREVCVV